MFMRYACTSICAKKATHGTVSHNRRKQTSCHVCKPLVPPSRSGVLPVHVLAQVDGLAIIISEVLVRLAVVAIVGAEKPLAAVPNEREHAKRVKAATVRGHECVCVPSSCVLVCFLTGTHPDIVSSLAIAYSHS